MPHSIITSKGQVTIPKAVRKMLNLKTGDIIDFRIQNGEVILVPLSKNVSEVFGILSRDNNKVLTVEEINEQLKKKIQKDNL